MSRPGVDEIAAWKPRAVWQEEGSREREEGKRSGVGVGGGGGGGTGEAPRGLMQLAGHAPLIVSIAGQAAGFRSG